MEEQAAKDAIKIDLLRCVVIEFSQSSGTHKYKQLNEEFAHELANAIRDASPERLIHVLLNEVPREWSQHEAFSSVLKPNDEDPSSELIEIEPRVGALELTCCGGESKVYSYMDSQSWPFITFVANQVVEIIDENEREVKEAKEEESKK